MATVTLIAAVALNRVIGRGGDMPWRLPTDMKGFKAATLGKPVVMGRRTLEAIGKPLAGRDNIVVTRRPSLPYEGVTLAASLEEALAHAGRRAGELGLDEVIVAGGGEIYSQAMPGADRLLITRVLAEPEGDAFFPEIDESRWRLVEDVPVATGPRDTADLRREVWLRR